MISKLVVPIFVLAKIQLWNFVEVLILILNVNKKMLVNVKEHIDWSWVLNKYCQIKITEIFH